METITLNNGLEMPALGLGVFQTPPDETRASRDSRLRVVSVGAPRRPDSATSG
jgi:diketogulonate reductase-like aldo/keto reductase